MKLDVQKAFDRLGFSDVVRRRTIVGVEFPEIGLANLQSFYADDLFLLILAVMCNISECHSILKRFGAVSGLHCV